jgi:hypothetical protein
MLSFQGGTLGAVRTSLRRPVRNRGTRPARAEVSLPPPPDETSVRIVSSLSQVQGCSGRCTGAVPVIFNGLVCALVWMRRVRQQTCSYGTESLVPQYRSCPDPSLALRVSLPESMTGCSLWRLLAFLGITNFVCRGAEVPVCGFETEALLCNCSNTAAMIAVPMQHSSAASGSINGWSIPARAC